MKKKNCTTNTLRKTNKMSNEKTIRDIYSLLSFDTNEEKAVAYGINSENDSLEYKQITRSGDIYDLIDCIASDKLANNYDFISLITYGWAAPIDSSIDQDIPPSQSEHRRRIRLMMVGGKENNGLIGSAIKFSDEDDIVIDEDNANGPLATAFEQLYK